MLTSSITKTTPNKPGVYVFKDATDKILYIGKAKNLQKRLQQYFAPGSLRKQEMLAQASTLDFHIVKNESEALYLEDNMIKKHQPYFNNLLKADNSYIYIKITKETFPQIITTRRKINDGATYIWPKHNTQHLKKFLQYLRQILQFRGCKNAQFKQSKICSDYYFGLCKGRCVLKNGTTPAQKPSKTRATSATIKIKAQEDYHMITQAMSSFFKGNTHPIKEEIKQQIQTAIQEQNFERATILRDILQEIDNLTQQQTVVLPETSSWYVIQTKAVGKRRISIILYFYEGKLIDIIRHKEHQTEKDYDEIFSDLQREFGTLYTKTDKQWDICSTIKTLKKSVEKNIRELANSLMQSYIINSSFEENNLIHDMLLNIQKRYNLQHIPYHIECIDISHLSGWRTSGGLSCLMTGLPYKKWYRRYKIQAKQSDDYEALQELLERRFKDILSSSEIISDDQLPSCLIIDGGKGQLGVIRKLCKDPKRKKILSQMDIISLGKGEARTKSNIWKTKKLMTSSLSPFIKGGGEAGGIWEEPLADGGFVKPSKRITETIYALDSNLKIHSQDMVYDQADKILLLARDEAHRFANSYRKKQMSKEFS